MPFGLTLAQIIDLANEIPGLVGDVKKLAPTLVPLLNQASATIEKANKSGALDDVQTAVAQIKPAVPEVLQVLARLQGMLEPISKAAAKVDHADLLGDVEKMVGQAKAVMPQLPALLAKVAHALTILSTSDTPEQAKQKIVGTDWNKVVDRAAGGAGPG